MFEFPSAEQETPMAVADSAASAATGRPSATGPGEEIVRTDLRKGSIGLAGVLMQSIAQISPTLGIFYTIAFTTAQAGITAPLTYLLAFILCLTLAVPLSGLARRMPSAGG